MDNTNYFDKEMEPLSRGGDGIKVLDEKQTPLGKLGFVNPSKENHKTCLVLKMCLKYVCFGVVVFAFIVLLQRVNKLESKIEVDKQEHHSSVSDKHTSETLRSPLKSLFMLTNDSGIGEKVTKLMTEKSPVPNGDIKEDANSSQKASSDASRSKKVQANDMVIGKHYFNIGMREDVMLQDCYHSHMKHSFPDIDYAFFGYDLFRGYPLAHGHDPGFTFPIFHADYTHGKQTADCRYSVPKGLVIVPDVSCVTSFTSEIIENSKQLNQELSVHADAGGGGFGVEFSASVGYRQASSDLSTHKSVYIISSARCNYYFSKFQAENPPPFTDIFVNWIEKLNTSSSNSTYLDFFHTFGTHFPKEIIFGARYNYEHKMKSSLYEKKRSSGVNVKVQASTSGLIRVSGGFGLSKEQREEASEFSNSVETNTITVGAAPPSNGDAMTWSASVQSNPVPSKYKLEPIENLFSEEYMGTLGVDYEAISVNLKALKEKYYESLASEDLYNLYNQINDMSSGRLTKILTVENGGQYGSWLTPQFCSVGTFAIGFNMMYDDNDAKEADRTGLNVINISCANRKGTRVKNQRSVQSPLGGRGHWTGDVICPRSNGIPLFLQSFELMVHEPFKKQSEDDTKANVVRFTCRDSHWKQQPKNIEKHIAGAKGQFGKSSEKCPKDSAICGLQSRVEGHIHHGDNTALNDVRFFCCRFK